MLGISLANFKKMEREGKLPIPRKMVGSSVRYRNTDVIKYMLADDGEDGSSVAPVEGDATPTESDARRKTA